MAVDPGAGGGGSSGRVYKTYYAKLIVAYNKTYSDVTNVPSSGSDSDFVYSDTTNNGSVWLGVNVSTTVPIRTGYDFLGWRESATDSSGTLLTPGTNIPRKVAYGSTVTVNLYPWFRIKTNTITYYANGGSSAPSAQQKNYGSTVNIVSTLPTRTGYIFLRWNTKADGTGTNYNPGQAYSENSNLSLYAIWKQAASVPTVNKTSANIGESIVISTNRVDQSAVHKLTYSFENSTGDIANDVTTSHIWVIPNSFYSLLSTKTSSSLIIYCETYVGGVKSGDTQSVSVTVSVPDNVRPTLTVTSTAVNEEDLEDILGTTLVQGYSKISFGFSSTPGEGASFQSYTITGPDIPSNLDPTANTVVTNTLSGSGTIVWTVYATDSRGRSSDIVTVQANVLTYSRPSISPISITRCDQYGNTNPYSGTYLRTRAFYSAQNVGSNVIESAKVYYRRVSSSSYSWTLGADLTEETGYGSGIWSDAFGEGTILPEYSYEIKYEVQDSIGIAKNKSASFVVSYPMPSSAGLSYGIHNDRLRLGGLVEEPGFVVDWVSKFRNTLTIQDLNAKGITGMIAGEGDNISLLLTGNM